MSWKSFVLSKKENGAEPGLDGEQFPQNSDIFSSALGELTRGHPIPSPETRPGEKEEGIGLLDDSTRNVHIAEVFPPLEPAQYVELGHYPEEGEESSAMELDRKNRQAASSSMPSTAQGNVDTFLCRSSLQRLRTDEEQFRLWLRGGEYLKNARSYRTLAPKSVVVGQLERHFSTGLPLSPQALNLVSVSLLFIVFGLLSFWGIPWLLQSRSRRSRHRIIKGTPSEPLNSLGYASNPDTTVTLR
ncbi:hypothetical protein H0H93_011159 [Arthromyces matolae]|nr:hypothetical protein H0H93_011159 [Arthromyces matolae]